MFTLVHRLDEPDFELKESGEVALQECFVEDLILITPLEEMTSQAAGERQFSD